MIKHWYKLGYKWKFEKFQLQLQIALKWYNGFLFLTYCYQWGWNVNIVSNAKVTTDFTIWNLQIDMSQFQLLFFAAKSA